MSRRRHAVVVSALIALSFVGLLTAQGPAPLPGQGPPTIVPPGLQDRVALTGSVRVIVELALSSGAYRPEPQLPDAASVAVQRNAIAAARAGLLSRLGPAGVRETRQFRIVPYVALEVDARGLAALGSAGPDVVRVMEDAIARPSLGASVPRIEGDQVWAAGFDGSGTAVAVLDSGVDAGHPFLGGRVTSEACFSSKTPRLSRSVCPNGRETQIGAGAAAPCGFEECGHGTHVAGIAAGDGPPAGQPFSGVAPAAEIMAVQVFSEIIDAATCGGTAPCLGAFESDIIAGLEHVYDTAVAGTLNVAAVNMSLGGGSFATPCDGEPFKPAIDTLRAVGIPSVVAAGNNAETAALSSPACVSSAVSVGATTATDEVAWFSNVAPFLSLFAPGEGIESAWPLGQYVALDGTSMAAPHVAGAWALVRQAVPSATVDEVLGAFQSTGLPVTDTRGWAPGTTTVSRVRVFQALATLTPLTNPAPQLISVTPAIARVGVPVALTLDGYGFNAFSVARWNGVDLPTTATSVTRLQAVVPAAELTLGTAMVSVFNPAPGGGTSLSAPVDVLPPPSLSVDATLVGPGEPVTVTLANGYGNTLDWLALAAVGAPVNNYIQSTFVGAGVLDRTWTVTMPATAGDYEFRLLLNNGFTLAATSPAVTVDPAISPVPVVASMSPTEALSGSAGLTLIVNGSGFAASSVVHWNGSARATTVVSTTQLRATIPSTDLATAGTAAVTVVTPAPGGGTSASLTFTVTPAPVLTVSASSVAAGASVTVTLTNGLGGSLDWLSFGATGAADNAYLQFTYVGAGVTTRTWTVTAPSAAGTYEFRLFRQGSFVRLATSPSVSVDAPPPPQLTVDTTTATSGDPVTVTLTNGLGGSTDWLAFAATGSADSSYLQFVYVGAGVTTRTWTVTAPATPGTYEFRLYQQGSFVRLATSPTVAVQAPPGPTPVLTVSATDVAAGSDVTVTLTDGPGGADDWLALALTSASDTSYLQSTLVGAGVTTRTWTVTMPGTAGTYEFRLFLDGGFTRAATSPAVTVQPPANPVPTLSVDATTAVAGSQVTVTLDNGLGGNADWLALAAVGAPANSYALFTYVGAGVTTRTWTVTMPATPGDYEFRLFLNGGYTLAATSPPVTVTAAPDPLLTVSTTTATGGQAVTVTLTNGLGGSLDWLALAATGAPDSSYLQFTYVGAGVTTRTWTVNMPATGGTYEFRLFRQGSFVRLATSPTVTVQAAPPPALSVSTSTATPGAPVTVTLTNGLGGNTDWLAFAATGAADNAYLYWTYVGTGVTTRTWTVTMPSAPGTYEFRLYKQASFVRLATSPPVTVTVPATVVDAGSDRR